LLEWQKEYTIASWAGNDRSVEAWLNGNGEVDFSLYVDPASGLAHERFSEKLDEAQFNSTARRVARFLEAPE
jgi:hypothetical protein